MPLSEGSNFWGGKQYQELSKLPIPGPAVVIDVRQGSVLDPLIWNLSVELEDLSREMLLNKVYRWRHLNNCIDLFHVAPMQEREPVQEMSDFRLTPPDGQTIPLRGKKALIGELVREHVDRVRNNRIGAARDWGNEGASLSLDTSSPEQTTVRVFFLVDAQDLDSLVSAATYAEWLKDSYHEYGEIARSGRDRRVTTLAVCMNADPLKHPARELAQYLNRVSGGSPAIDALILLHTYGDDEAFIGGDIQSYQVELILYALLLLPPQSIAVMNDEIIDDLRLNPYVLSEEEAQKAVAPWPIFMVGISSLEYSARWGGRWLDYKLVAKIIEIMLDETEVDQEDRLGRLRQRAREKLDQWYKELNELVPDALLGAIPELQALAEIQRYLASSPFKAGKPRHSVQELETFRQRISQLYVEGEKTLESAMESAALIPWLLKRDYMREARPENEESPAAVSLYARLLVLQSRASQLPASLFDGASGMLARALRHTAEFTEEIEELHQVAIHPPDIHEYLEQFQRQAEHECQRMERVVNSYKGFLDGRTIRRQREESYRRLSNTIQKHLYQVREVIKARVALEVLKEAGLYNPEGSTCLYQQHLKQLYKLMREAQELAALQHERAYERLQVSLNEPPIGGSQTPARLSLNNRKDLLNWEQVLESSEQLDQYLEAMPTELNLLMEWLLRLVGDEKPLFIFEQYWQQFQARQQTFQAAYLEEKRLQALNTMLVAVLLLLDVVDFDITALQPLLDNYLALKDRFSDTPSFLENNILELQRIIREARATRSVLRSGSNGSKKQMVQPQEQSPDFILAAWVNNQRAGDSDLMQALDRSGIVAHLMENKIKPDQAINDLRSRNRLLGYRDDMAGENRYYLLLAPGEESQEFLKEVAEHYPTDITPLLFPDAEKLLYLHVHNVRYMPPVAIDSPQKQVNSN